MRTWKCILLAVALMTLGACVYVPPSWYESDAINHVEEIEDSVSTKDQVLEHLGEPTYRYEDEHTNVFRYYGTKSYGLLMIFTPAPGGIGGLPLKERRWLIRVQFDENDIVEHLTVYWDVLHP
jgi:hypothetical protein